MFDEETQKRIAIEILDSQCQGHRRWKRIAQWMKKDGGLVVVYYQGSTSYQMFMTNYGAKYNNAQGCVKTYETQSITDENGKVWKNPHKVGTLFVVEFVDIDWNIRVSLADLHEFDLTTLAIKDLLQWLHDQRGN